MVASTHLTMVVGFFVSAPYSVVNVVTVGGFGVMDCFVAAIVGWFVVGGSTVVVVFGDVFAIGVLIVVVKVVASFLVVAFLVMVLGISVVSLEVVVCCSFVTVAEFGESVLGVGIGGVCAVVVVVVVEVACFSEGISVGFWVVVVVVVIGRVVEVVAVLALTVVCIIVIVVVLTSETEPSVVLLLWMFCLETPSPNSSGIVITGMGSVTFSSANTPPGDAETVPRVTTCITL